MTRLQRHLGQILVWALLIVVVSGATPNRNAASEKAVTLGVPADSSTRFYCHTGCTQNTYFDQLEIWIGHFGSECQSAEPETECKQCPEELPDPDCFNIAGYVSSNNLCDEDCTGAGRLEDVLAAIQENDMRAIAKMIEKKEGVLLNTAHQTIQVAGCKKGTIKASIPLDSDAFGRLTAALE